LFLGSSTKTSRSFFFSLFSSCAYIAALKRAKAIAKSSIFFIVAFIYLFLFGGRTESAGRRLQEEQDFFRYCSRVVLLYCGIVVLKPWIGVPSKIMLFRNCHPDEGGISQT